MQTIDSRLNGEDAFFADIKAVLENQGFVLGGNWDYDHGCFDKALDEQQKVWLRIPFQVTRGEIDASSDHADAFVQLGFPYVLKHEYEEGLDGEAKMRAMGGLIDQFQEPKDADAPVEPKWIGQAEQALRRVEDELLH